LAEFVTLKVAGREAGRAGAQPGAACKSKRSKGFFFEKKKQKTFGNLGAALSSRG
jgi:hypothetical protein